MKIIKSTLLSGGIKILDVNILDHGYALTGTDWQAEVVNPAYSRLYFILDGDGYYYTGNSNIPFKEMFCYLLPRGFTFSYGCKSFMEQIFFHLSLTDTAGYDLLSDVENPLSCHLETRDSRILIDCLQSDNPRDVLCLQAAINNYLWRIFNENQTILPTREYSQCVRLALNQIHKNENIKLSLNKIAQDCFVSQTTLSKRFRLELNTTVSAYIDNVVFTRAQLLLKNSELTIGDISDTLGFCDQFYFSRRFTQRYKESPVSYRKRALM